MAGFFVTDRSFFGRCHPAVRLIALSLACLPPLAVNRPLEAVALIVIYLAAAWTASAWRNLWRLKWLILVFLTVAMVMWPLFYRSPGPALFRLGPLAPSADSLLFALTMGLRLIALLIAGVTFLSSTRIEDMTSGLERIGLPYRVSFAFSLAFRLTPLFLETARQISAAQKARGLDLEGSGLVARLKGYVAILAPVLMTALRRAEGLALALESKGFGRSARRTSMVQYGLGWRDLSLLGAVLALVCLTVFWRWDLWGFRHAVETWAMDAGPLR